MVEDEPVISLHAITGTPKPQTMRVRWAMGSHRLMVLMDSGSTHNFLSSCVAMRLGLRPTHAELIQVMVVSNEQIRCFGRCAGMLLGI
jgi:hypothetical protein